MPGQRVRDGDADVVGQRPPHEGARRLDLGGRPRPGSRTAGRTRTRDAARAQAASRLLDLLDPRPLLHGVEHRLRARLGAHPDGLAAGVAERLDLALAQEQVGAAQALEGRRRAALADGRGVGRRPAGLQAEDVVDERDVVGRVLLAQPRDLGGDALGRAHGVALAPDRLRAPVAVERAAARRRDVHREAAVPRPGGAVRDRRRRGPTRGTAARRGPSCCRAGRSRSSLPSGARNARPGSSRGSPSARPVSGRAGRVSVSSPSPTIDEVGAIGEVALGVVGRVAAADDRRRAARPRGLDHPERRLAHPQQAHLREVVEVVLEEHRELGRLLVQRRRPAGLVGLEHRVEQADVVARARAASSRRTAFRAAGRAASPRAASGRSAGSRTGRGARGSCHGLRAPSTRASRSSKAASTR